MANKYKAESRRAQKAARRLKACESKAAYATAEEAYQKGQRVYQCRYCGKFHRSGAFAKLVATVSRNKRPAEPGPRVTAHPPVSAAAGKAEVGRSAGA
jgi:hypothetical protein